MSSPPQSNTGPRAKLAAAAAIMTLSSLMFACAGPSAGEPTAPPPTAAPTPTEDLDQDAPPSVNIAGTGTGALSSYKARHATILDITDSPDGTGRVTIETNMTYRQDPPTIAIDLTYHGQVYGQDFPGDSGVNLVILSDMAYLELIEEGAHNCTPVPVAELGIEGPMTVENVMYQVEFFPPFDSLLPALPVLDRVMPNEAINGVESRHYRAENADLPIFMFDEAQPTGAATVDAWLAREGGFVTRITVQAPYEDGQDRGQISVTYDLLSFNQPYNVMPIPGCEA